MVPEPAMSVNEEVELFFDLQDFGNNSNLVYQSKEPPRRNLRKVLLSEFKTEK